MIDSTAVLVSTAFSIALFHTVASPDHYLPFVLLGKAENWPLRRILRVTVLCGAGHVLSSLLLATLGAALGWSALGAEWLNGIRGNLAAGALVLLGLAYMIWGIFRARRHGSDGHVHLSAGGQWTVRALFLIFVFGACEPMIPLVMVPAAQHSPTALLAVSSVFAVTTIAAMAAAVAAAHAGIALFEFRFVRRYIHAFSGFALCASGLLITVLGA